MQDYGEWGDVVRELADHQVERYAVVARWPLAECLAAYEARLRREAARHYQMALITLAIGAQAGSKQRQPELPAILKD
mgnify:CR=1 FL=1